MNGDPAELLRMAGGLAEKGVTAFVPTTLAGPWDQITRAVDAVAAAMRQPGRGARILGVHLEGPYFHPAQRGAQNLAHLATPRPEDYLPLLDRYSIIRRVSAAPELPGALELGQELRRRGIVAAIAHSDATYQQVVTAVEHGYSHVTHLFSGMSTVKRIDAYRVSGVLEAALLLDELTTEIIADGHHLPPSLMRLALKNKGLDRICLVSDAMEAAGLGAGNYQLGGLAVVVEAAIPEVFEIPTQARNRVAKLADRSAFAGSVATMDQLVRNLVQWVGLDILDAVRLATFNPARLEGIDHETGSIAKGKRADLIVFDQDVEVQLTMVAGELVVNKLSGMTPGARGE